VGLVTLATQCSAAHQICNSLLYPFSTLVIYEVVYTNVS
jgi:hypothetical protein